MEPHLPPQSPTSSEGASASSAFSESTQVPRMSKCPSDPTAAVQFMSETHRSCDPLHHPNCFLLETMDGTCSYYGNFLHRNVLIVRLNLFTVKLLPLQSLNVELQQGSITHIVYNNVQHRQTYYFERSVCSKNFAASLGSRPRQSN